MSRGFFGPDFLREDDHVRYHSGGNCRLISQRVVVGVFLSHLALARPRCDFIAGSHVGRVFRVDLFFLCHADPFGVRRDNAGELDGAKPDLVGSRLGSDVSGGAGCSPGGIAFEWGRSIGSQIGRVMNDRWHVVFGVFFWVLLLTPDVCAQSQKEPVAS